MDVKISEERAKGSKMGLNSLDLDPEDAHDSFRPRGVESR